MVAERQELVLRVRQAAPRRLRREAQQKHNEYEDDVDVEDVEEDEVENDDVSVECSGLQ